MNQVNEQNTYLTNAEKAAKNCDVNHQQLKKHFGKDEAASTRALVSLLLPNEADSSVPAWHKFAATQKNKRKSVSDIGASQKMAQKNGDSSKL